MTGEHDRCVVACFEMTVAHVKLSQKGLAVNDMHAIAQHVGLLQVGMLYMTTTYSAKYILGEILGLPSIDSDSGTHAITVFDDKIMRHPLERQIGEAEVLAAENAESHAPGVTARQPVVIVWGTVITVAEATYLEVTYFTMAAMIHPSPGVL